MPLKCEDSLYLNIVSQHTLNTGVVKRKLQMKRSKKVYPGMYKYTSNNNNMVLTSYYIIVCHYVFKQTTEASVGK